MAVAPRAVVVSPFWLLPDIFGLESVSIPSLCLNWRESVSEKIRKEFFGDGRERLAIEKLSNSHDELEKLLILSGRRGHSTCMAAVKTVDYLSY